MKRFIIVFYGLLTALCWLACLGIMIFKPFLSATNERCFIGFGVMGVLFTFIWLAIIPPFSTPKSLSHGN